MGANIIHKCKTDDLNVMWQLGACMMAEKPVNKKTVLR